MVQSSYLGVCKQEDSRDVLHPCHGIEFLEIIVESCVVIATTQLNLEALAAIHMRCQPEVIGQAENGEQF